MNSDLHHITIPIVNELEEFRKEFRLAMKSKVGLVELISRYITRQKGKKLRPILVLLSAKLCGEISRRTYIAATLVEMLHTATLIHDDVVDDAKTRRGFPSINALWKNKIAILMGDYLLSRGLLHALENNEYDFLHITSKAVKRMSEGELLHIQKSRKIKPDEEAYFKITSHKTASLFSACCEMGAASTTSNKEKIKLLMEFGENIGIAFQLKDDVLDYVGKEKFMGKSSGSDLKGKILTLPLIYALKKSTKKESKEVINVIKNGTYPKNKYYVLDFINKYNGINHTYEMIRRYCEISRTKLINFKPSEIRNSLFNFVNYIEERVS